MGNKFFRKLVTNLDCFNLASSEIKKMANKESASRRAGYNESELSAGVVEMLQKKEKM